MTKRDALKLTPGEIIVYGDSQWIAACRRKWWGRVVHVTKNGGVLVRDFAQHWHYTAPEVEASGPERWIPYNHVISVG